MKNFGKKGGGGAGGGFNMNMIKQAQKMQQDMAKMQEDLEAKEYTAAAGGGAVSATVNGQKQLISVKINPEAVSPEDVELLEDMVVAAVNAAINQAEESASEEMKKITGGLNLPGLF